MGIIYFMISKDIFNDLRFYILKSIVFEYYSFMKIVLRYILLVSLLVNIYSCKNEPKMFKSLSAQETGITFSNRITENDTMNILDFEYIYGFQNLKLFIINIWKQNINPNNLTIRLEKVIIPKKMSNGRSIVDR